MIHLFWGNVSWESVIMGLGQYCFVKLWLKHISLIKNNHLFNFDFDLF